MISVYAPEWALPKIKFILEDLIVSTYAINFNYFCHDSDHVLFTNHKLSEIKVKLLSKKYYTTRDRSLIQRDLALRYNKDKRILYSEQVSEAVDLEVNRLGINQDIFFAVFFVFTQCHEFSEIDRDDHGRVKSSQNLFVQLGIHEIPVIDFTLHQFVGIISNVFQFRVAKPQFQVQLSHDVDRPARYAFNTNRKILFSSIRDISRGILAPVFSTMFNKSSFALEKHDPYFTFNWILEKNRDLSTHSVFNFFSKKNNSMIDAHYDIEHPVLQSLVKKILNNGDRCGLHLSYLASYDAKIAQSEVDAFLSALDVECNKLSSRNHYLRWDPERTPQLLEQVGINVDTTYGFYDAIGFRAGTSRKFRFYDLKNDRPYSFYEEPLIFMECALFSPKYSSLQKDAAYQKVIEVIDSINSVGGKFEMLWHNSELYTEEQRRLYVNIIKHACRHIK